MWRFSGTPSVVKSSLLTTTASFTSCRSLERRESVSTSISIPDSSSASPFPPRAGQSCSSCHLSKSLKISPAATSPSPMSAIFVAPWLLNPECRSFGTLWNVETQSSMLDYYNYLAVMEKLTISAAICCVFHAFQLCCTLQVLNPFKEVCCVIWGLPFVTGSNHHDRLVLWHLTDNRV